MVLWNTGSICTHLGGLLGWDVIGNISGTTLNNIVTQEVNFINTYGNFGVGTVDISPNFQPVLIQLSLSQVLLATKMQQGTINSVSLGELSVSQGGDSTEYARILRQDAIQRLQELGRYMRFKRVIASA
jgi:hypothetical protein